MACFCSTWCWWTIGSLPIPLAAEDITIQCSCQYLVTFQLSHAIYKYSLSAYTLYICVRFQELAQVSVINHLLLLNHTFATTYISTFMILNLPSWSSMIHQLFKMYLFCWGLWHPVTVVPYKCTYLLASYHICLCGVFSRIQRLHCCSATLHYAHVHCHTHTQLLLQTVFYSFIILICFLCTYIFRYQFLSHTVD